MSMFTELMERDRTSESDLERASLFLILGSVPDLYDRRNQIYDFTERCINPDCMDTLPLSSGHMQLLKLAFALYNGYPVDVIELFSRLDEGSFELAIAAIRIRFNKLSE